MPIMAAASILVLLLPDHEHVYQELVIAAN